MLCSHKAGLAGSVYKLKSIKKNDSVIGRNDSEVLERVFVLFWKRCHSRRKPCKLSHCFG